MFHQTKGNVISQAYHKRHAYTRAFKCVHFNFFLTSYRHIYVADLFDHNVHVLERRIDHGLVFVKVSTVDITKRTKHSELGCITEHFLTRLWR